MRGSSAVDVGTGRTRKEHNKWYQISLNPGLSSRSEASDPGFLLNPGLSRYETPDPGFLLNPGSSRNLGPSDHLSNLSEVLPAALDRGLP
eukprot:6748738-Pyramimonas_sp.AAC.1